MKGIASKPVFWGGVALITFAYFTAQGSAAETGQGIENALTIIAAFGGVALVIYAVNRP